MPTLDTFYHLIFWAFLTLPRVQGNLKELSNGGNV